MFPETCCTNGTLRVLSAALFSRPASGPMTVLLTVVPCGRARKTHQWTPLSQRWASWRRVAARWVKKEARHRAQPELACPQQTMDGTSNSFSSCNAGAGFAIPRQQPRPRALRLEFQAMAIAPSPSASRPKPSSTAHIHRNSVLRQCCVTQVHGFAIRSGWTSRAKPASAPEISTKAWIKHVADARSTAVGG